MFDPETAEFLRSAPGVPGLDPGTLPQTLTRRYAELVARRIRTAAGTPDSGARIEWPLSRIADIYELITSVHHDPKVRRAAAFVAATAQQISAQDERDEERATHRPLIERDSIDPDLAASLLFLAAEQHADAREAVQRVKLPLSSDADGLESMLARQICSLAVGDVAAILDLAGTRPQQFSPEEGLEERGNAACLMALLTGIELFAREILHESIDPKINSLSRTPREYFSRVLELTQAEHIQGALGPYPGPRHLAALLLAVYEGTAATAICNIDTPPGVDNGFWRGWLRQRASHAPFLWPNHRDAVNQGFHYVGNSAVMILPTGAGKTTVSCLKVASTLGHGKNVVFVAPTHALVEQLTDDLQAIFPEELLGSLVSSDFDRLFASGTSLRRIEVMTPERCLALLSYSPESFSDVGLMVFDECHLLSPKSGLRRALDGMFCVLAFASVIPSADFLFLSAMIRNGEEFASWIGDLTGRVCVFVDTLWKPSRQARGVVFYEQDGIDRARAAAMNAQRAGDAVKRKPAKGLRSAAREELRLVPFALFGLRHNWLDLQGKKADVSINQISDSPVELSGELRDGQLYLKPNVNSVAEHIASAAARRGLKVIVFVNVKSHAVSTAREIAGQLGVEVTKTPDENEKWCSLEAELGDLKHALLTGNLSAVPHNSQMIRLERDLAERMFRRPDGARVIVATPTLAQGLNLPAQMAILASDRRADDGGSREALGAHEILNAAARAGRAGHLANGLVLLIPEAVLAFRGEGIRRDVIERLGSLMPEDDRCIDLTDPLQVVLDRISAGAMEDVDVEYALNRLSATIALEGDETDIGKRFAIKKSFGAFSAARREDLKTFENQLSQLNEVLAQCKTESAARVSVVLAAQSGVSISVLESLRQRLLGDLRVMPHSISEWVAWIFRWLADDEGARNALLARDRAGYLRAAGWKGSVAPRGEVMQAILPGAVAWVSGQPLCEIERQLGGDPELELECSRARILVTTLVPMSLAFIGGLVSRIAQEIPEIATSSVVSCAVIECLPTAIRRGFDSPLKLAFAEVGRVSQLSRVQVHRAYEREVGSRAEINLEGVATYREVLTRMEEILQTVP